MSSKIIIVGNGTSLLDKENGSIIDSYEEVVRFNSFEIQKYEKFVGTKSTIWFNVINFNDKNNWRVLHDWKQIYLHSWQWDESKDKLYINFIDFFNQKNLDNSKIIKTVSTTTREISDYANDTTYKCFSTGMIAIWEMLKLYDTVDITGFDWWSRDSHHYNDKAARGTLHKPIKEKQIIDKLISEQKIFIL
jgi:hypothetical protein